ncbi:NAD(P)H-dependent oxidoreductase [Piscinibacter sp. XHJ-5]|uniref:NADPH-dependent FMN reductase n=1 Tax=Piscinibacter sp. XHJ-5 TaxID=3037797 RepID=UPI0024531AA8|nr:NAD(P)H-dependent oxidoreductase [Piscinibacter sp. XHJ-5]
MTTVRKVAVLVGSLRKESFSLKTAKAVIGLAPPELAMEIVDFADVPLFNQDWEAAMPPAAAAFKARIAAAEAVLFVTPEYNRSVPGALKNAIDVASRPYGQSAWSGKPGGVISVSPGAISGFGANHHLRQSMVFLDVPMLQQPEAYIGNAHKLFDANGAIASDDTRQFLQNFVQAYARWVERNLAR